jgi:hypothetical protein
VSKKIQIARLTNTAGARHTVKVKLPLDGGEEEIRVVYRGLSLRDSVELEKKFEQEDFNSALPKLLAEHIIELPDIVDGETPVAPTVEFFETLDTFVLHRINKAIREDRTANPTT